MPVPFSHLFLIHVVGQLLVLVLKDSFIKRYNKMAVIVSLIIAWSLDMFQKNVLNKSIFIMDFGK